jgi:hypothetical protein
VITLMGNGSTPGFIKSYRTHILKGVIEMPRFNCLNLTLCGLLALCVCIVACDNKALDALKAELNRTNFNSVFPANDWTYAGGLAVYDSKNPKGGTTFYGLPAGVDKPQTEPANAAWGAQEIDSSFTVQALVSGLGHVLKSPISGGVAVNYNAKTTLAQINATGTRAVHPDAILSNPTVAGQITQWLKTGHLSVYIVSTALDTSNLSAKTTDSGGVTAAFGGTIKECAPPTGGSSAAGSTTGGSTTGGSTAGGSTTGGTTTGGTTTSGTGGGTASLQGCKTNDDSFTLTTTTPLVFATLTNAVTLQPDGASLFFNPAPQVPPGGFERGKAIPTQAATLSSGKWKKASWPAK